MTLISQSIGPPAVGWLTDHVFSSDGIRYSLLVVSASAMTIALALLAAGLRAYPRTVEARGHWTYEPS
jgi:hypothetical protein